MQNSTTTNHLPFNNILSFIDAGEVARAAWEAAIVVSSHVPAAKDFAVYTKGVDTDALNDALWALYQASEVYPSLVNRLGRVIWPGNPTFGSSS